MKATEFMQRWKKSALLELNKSGHKAELLKRRLQKAGFFPKYADGVEFKDVALFLLCSVHFKTYGLKSIPVFKEVAGRLIHGAYKDKTNTLWFIVDILQHPEKIDDIDLLRIHKDDLQGDLFVGGSEYHLYGLEPHTDDQKAAYMANALNKEALKELARIAKSYE